MLPLCTLYYIFILYICTIGSKCCHCVLYAVCCILYPACCILYTSAGPGGEGGEGSSEPRANPDVAQRAVGWRESLSQLSTLIAAELRDAAQVVLAGISINGVMAAPFAERDGCVHETGDDWTMITIITKTMTMTAARRRAA